MSCMFFILLSELRRAATVNAQSISCFLSPAEKKVLSEWLLPDEERWEKKKLRKTKKKIKILIFQSWEKKLKGRDTFREVQYELNLL